MSETLVELSEKLLAGISPKFKGIEESRFSKRNLDSNFKKIKEKTEKKNRILVFGINPAGGCKEAEETEYYEYILNEDLQKHLTKEETNVGYFRQNYELFDKENTTMTWILKDEDALKKKFSDDKYTICKKVQQQEMKKKNIIIFCDLVYYHDTNSNNIKKSISENYKLSLNKIRKLDFQENIELIENIEEIIKAHIEILDPKLIVVTNAFASQLICGALKNEKDKDSSWISYKGIPILFGGMVSGGHTMDIFSQNRLKRDISEKMKEF